MKLSMSMFVSALTLVLLVSGQGYGEEDVAKFPSKPIMFIMPVPPGGTIELGCRLLTKEAETSLKQPIVMVNKPGSALTVGTAAVASAKPDGYTIGFSGGPAAVLDAAPREGAL
jgi:tripartite-type tricarboxylate transporter receptor subunit TctC